MSIGVVDYDSTQFPSLKQFEQQVVYVTEETVGNIVKIPCVFNHLNEYRSRFYRLLLEEAKSDVRIAYETTLGSQGALKIAVQRTWNENGCTFFEFYVRSVDRPPLADGTVVYLSLSELSKPRSHTKCCASVITQSNERSNKVEARLIEPISEAAHDLGSILECIRASSAKHLWAIPATRLTTHTRHFDALAALQDTRSHFQRFLIKPSSSNVEEPASSALTKLGLENSKFATLLKSTLNDPQFEALLLSAHHATRFSCSDHYSVPFSLIQGPPGTGKTKVITSLANALHLLQFQYYFDSITALISRQSKAQAPSMKRKRTMVHAVDTQTLKPRILICAPSNAAVDNVLDRIIHNRFLQMDASQYSPDVMRLVSGEANVSMTAQAVSIEHRVKSLVEMSADDWSAWYSRQYHTFTTSELKLKEKFEAQCEDELWESNILQLHEIRDRALGDLARLERLRPLHGGSVAGDLRMIREISDDLAASFVDEAEIVCCTLTSLSKRFFRINSRPFKTIIVDEACQAIEPATLIPLTIYNAHCVLVGDPQQLPATVKSRVAKTARYDRSLFERLMEAGVPAKLLSIQYRMHPEIRCFPSCVFYSGALVDAPKLDQSRYLPAHKYWPFKPFMVFDVVQGQEERASTLSRYNKNEAVFIVDLLVRYLTLFPLTRKSRLDIMVLSGYREQCTLVHRLLQQTSIVNCVNVSTIDAFQGQESDVIVLSCVRTSATDIGFLADLRRLNVAITRARCSLWVICKCETVSKFHIWQLLLKNAKERGCYTTSLDAIFSSTKETKRTLFAKCSDGSG